MAYEWHPRGYFQLFISHISSQHHFASEMSDWLLRFGISGFVAHQHIEPTQEWQTTIESALTSMNAIVALMHPGFHASKWCDQEVGIAIGREKLVISVRLGADPHGFIGKYQAISGTDKTSLQVAEELAKRLAIHPSSQYAIARGAVRRLGQSSSFDESQQIINFLETIPSAGPNTIGRLEMIPQKNDQVRGARNVEGRVMALVNKWRRAST